MKKQWIMGDSLKSDEEGFPPTPNHYARTAGTAAQQAHAKMTKCDELMRQNYAENHQKIGEAIFPFLYSEFTPDGGRYTLLINDSERLSAKPVPAVYEVAKSVAHIPLGVWSILTRYADYPQNGEWLGALTTFSQALLDALNALPELEITEEQREHLHGILNPMFNFANACVKAKTFSIGDYTKLSYQIGKHILYLQNLAAEVQVKAFTEVLQEWRKQLGETRWAQLYVVVGAQWTLSTENVHQLIIESNMTSKAHAATNLFVTSMPLSSLEEAQALCGRVVGDRVMARETLAEDSLRGKQNVFSLSSSRDLISKAAEDVIRSLCPHLDNV